MYVGVWLCEVYGVDVWMQESQREGVCVRMWCKLERCTEEGRFGNN